MEKDKRQKEWTRVLLLFLFPLSLFPLLGCGAHYRRELLEHELRKKETELRETREELGRSEFMSEALQRQVLDVGQCRKVPHDASCLTANVKEVVLGRLTGGYDDDHCPGDEALQVILEPRDADGHALKVSGTLHVMALEISPEGLKRPLSSWEMPPGELRRHWRNGLLSTGYYVVLPWKNWPCSEKLRVIAQLTLLDGRVFEADKDVTIRLVPAAMQKTLVPGPVGPPLPGPDEVLPVPQQIVPMPTSTSKKQARSRKPVENLGIQLRRPE